MAQLILKGDYSSFVFDVTADPGGGADIAAVPGQAIVGAGSSLDVNAPSSETVTFAGATGQLILEQPGGFTGHIDGFTGTAPDDVIDVVGIDFLSGNFKEGFDQSRAVLSVSDGNQSASLAFVGFNGAFTFTSDGHGGTLIMDPPATGAISKPDQFVFRDSAPRLGYDLDHDCRLGRVEIEGWTKPNSADSDYWTLEARTTSGKQVMLNEGSENEHSTTHTAPFQSVSLTNIHAYDFVFPYH